MKWLSRLSVLVLFGVCACGSEVAPGPSPASAEGEAAPAPAALPKKEASVINAALPAAAAPEAEAVAEAKAPSEAAGEASEASEKGQATAKPAAPVAVSASIGPSEATLDVVFKSEGTGVLIKVWGVDGLKLTGGSTPVSLASVKSGQSSRMTVQYQAPTTQSNLAVSVSGTFGGQEQTKVQSFTVNPDAPMPAKAQVPTTTTDKDGRRVKVIKAQ
jgi:hypothetical protein